MVTRRRGVMLAALAAGWMAGSAPEPAAAQCSDISGLPGPRVPCPQRTRQTPPAAAVPQQQQPQQRRTVSTPAVAPSSGGNNANSAIELLGGVSSLLSGLQALDPPAAEAAEPEPEPNPKACNERDRQRGCRDWDGAAADFSGQIRSDDTYEIDLSAKGPRRPVTKCDDRGCWIEYVAAPPPKKQPKKPVQTGPSLRDILRAKLDLKKLEDGGVPKSEHKTILFSKYPADVVNKVLP